MKTKKLLKVADMLDNLTPEEAGKFNMESWNSEGDCGTTFCAIGWAAHKGLFKNLSLFKGEHSSHNTLNYRCFKGWDAVTALFEINGHDADYLFSDNYQRDTPELVAENIRDYVAGRVV